MVGVINTFAVNPGMELEIVNTGIAFFAMGSSWLFIL
jgi:hypothetical protein